MEKNIIFWEMDVYTHGEFKTVSNNIELVHDFNSLYELEDFFDDMAQNPYSFNNSFSNMAIECYGAIIDFRIINILSIEEFKKYNNYLSQYKSNRFRISFKTPAFRQHNRFDYDAEQKWYAEYFNKKYTNIDFLDLFQVDSNTQIEKSKSVFETIISFDMTQKIFDIIFKDEPKIFEENIEEEMEENLFEIKENADITKIKEGELQTYNDVFAFLEGDFFMNEQYKHYINLLEKNNKSYIAINNLYKHPENFSYLKTYDVKNIVLSTTGLNPDLKKIIKVFIDFKIIPNDVFIIGENNLNFDFSSIDEFKNVKFHKLNMI